VTDAATGQTYTGLNHFVDVEDAGDAYTSCPFPESQPVSTVEQPATITCTERGPLRATFRIERTLDIPIGLTADRQNRSEETIGLTLVSDVSIYAGQPGVYITTRTDNRAEDHKLSVNFPTGLRVARAYVDESYFVAERDLSLPSSEGWVEDPSPLMHQRAFTDLSDGSRGLAILNRGLPSVEVGQDGTVALTLLRCVGWLSRDDLWVRRIAAGPLVPTPGAQCQGEYTFHYAILPHAGDWQNVAETAYNYNAPLLGVRGDTHPGLELHDMNITRDDPRLVTPIPWPRGGVLPDRHSFVTVEPSELVLSALYRSGDDLIIRVYNVTREAVDGTLTLGFPVTEAHRVNLAEAGQERLTAPDNQIELHVEGAEVYTVKVRPRK
jgi:alpha-mannosidase